MPLYVEQGCATRGVRMVDGHLQLLILILAFHPFMP